MSKALPKIDPPVTIRAEPSALDPSLCKFTTSRIVQAGGPFLFENKAKAAGSPLPEALFQIPGVATVLIAGNVVTIGKSTDQSWVELMRPIGAAIRSQLGSGVPAVLLLDSPGGPGKRTDEEIQQAVQALLDREVNPSVAGHGGKISVREVKNRKLFISMSGGCQGCASSQVTLKQGVEVMVRRVVPEIEEIIDATDHAAGAQPYYPR